VIGQFKTPYIQKLIKTGIVNVVSLNDDQRQRGYPWTFYKFKLLKMRSV
jgi:hypothetical protein